MSESCDFLCLYSHFSAVVIYGATIPIYILLIITMIRNRHDQLSGAFFQFCISNGFADAAMVIEIGLLIKVRLHLGYLRSFFYAGMPVILTGFHFWGNFGSFVQSFNVVLIAANRYTNLKRFGQEDWSTSSVRAAIIGSWLLAAILASPNLIWGQMEAVIVNGTWESENFKDLWFISTFGTFSALFYLVCLVATAGFYCGAFYHYGKLKSLTTQQDHAAQLRVSIEMRLVIVGVILCVNMLIISLLDLAMSFMNYNPFESVLFVLAWDSFTNVNPYLILAFSEKARQCFRKTLRCASTEQAPMIWM